MRKFLLIASLLSIPLQPIFATKVPPKSSWTYLIFMNAKNPLEPFAKYNILDMEKIGSNTNLNIVVQVGKLSNNDVVRMRIEKSKNPKEITSPILQDLGATDMGSYKSLQDFITWGIKNFPADHYFISVWDHGNGWHYSANNNLPDNKLLVGDISYDDITGHHITTEELGRSLHYAAGIAGHPIDIYGSDACYMSMVEIASEMLGAVNVFIGSQPRIPKNGWPYSQFISRWQASNNPSARMIAKILVDEYHQYYTLTQPLPHTLVAFDLSKLLAFNLAVHALTNEIETLNPTARKAVLDVISSSLNFDNPELDYRDFGNFLQLIQQQKIKGLSDKTLDIIFQAINNLVIISSASPNYKLASGISAWLPTNKIAYNIFAARYQAMIFNQETNWHDALGYLF